MNVFRGEANEVLVTRGGEGNEWSDEGWVPLNANYVDDGSRAERGGSVVP